MKRKMKVSYKANRNFISAVPMLRLANRYMRDIAKIGIGDAVEGEYAEGSLLIRKIANI